MCRPKQFEPFSFVQQSETICIVCLILVIHNFFSILGYLQLFCETLIEELDSLPGDSRTHIGFLTFDRSLHFYNLSEGLSQPQMLVVSDVEGEGYLVYFGCGVYHTCLFNGYYMVYISFNVILGFLSDKIVFTK